MTGERVYPPFEADERATLTAFLDCQRATLALKCDGLSDDQLRERAIPPSSLSLLGLVRHMAEVMSTAPARRLAPGKNRGLASLASVIS